MADIAKLTIRLNPADNIVVARADLLPGAPIPGEGVTVKSRIPIGHKLAIKPLAKGDTVIKYGTDIGRVVAPIGLGEHAHVHNIKTKRW